MSVDYKCRQIYNDVIHDVTKTEETWKSVLSLCGRIYRYEFDNVLMVYAQRPKSTLIADYDTWKKVDRYVKRGSKGIAIYPSRALSPYCRYVFDISDTGGRNVNLTWSLDGYNLTDYAKKLAGEGSITLTGNESLGELKNKIWDFTKSEIRGILKETHAMRVNVLADKLGNQIISGMQDIRDDGLQIIERSIFYVVAGRCGFDQPKGEDRLSTITQIVKEDMIFELGSLVSDVSCEVLRNISRSIKAVERERRMSYERGTTVQRGSRRDAVSEHRDGEGEPVTDREVRSDGDGLSEREPLREVSVPVEIRETDGGLGTGERGSVPDGGSDDGAVSERASGEESGRHDGDVEDQRAGTEADTGNHHPRSDQQVSLDSDDSKTGNTPLVSSDDTQGEYHQISFMDMMESPDNEFDRELKELENFGEERGADTASLFSHNRNRGWETADEYLSGNVRDKLVIAEANAKLNPEIFGTNVEALKEVQPKDLDASEIDVRIGTTWIEPEDYQAFIYELLDTPYWARDDGSPYRRNGIKVNLNRFSMEWFIENKSRDNHSVAATKTYGTGRIDAYSIFESTLNMRVVTVRDRIEDGGGKYHYEVNKEATMLASFLYNTKCKGA